MGGSFSKNVANAIAEAVTQIQTNASGTNEQKNICINMFNTEGCVIDEVEVSQRCAIQADSQQVIDQITNNNLKNNIAQDLLQRATSTVGAMGIGYASASN